MHLYKHFFKLLKNNRVGLIIYATIMVVMIVMEGSFAASEFSDPLEHSEYTSAEEISYADYDDSALSRGIIEYLSKDNNLTDYKGMTDDQIKNLIYFDITSYHIDIPAGLEESIDADEDMKVEYCTGTSGSSSTYSITNGVDAYIRMYKSYRNMGMSADEAVQKAYENMTRELDISVYSNGQEYNGTNATEWSIYNIIKFCSYLTLGMLTLSAGFVIIKSNDEKIKSRIASAPVSILKMTITDTLGLFSMGLILWAVLSAGMYIAGANTNLMRERGWLLVIGTLVMILTNCGLTAFIASFKLKSNVLSMVSNIICLSMSFLTGVFVPQWLLGEKVLAVGKFMPFYWSTRALDIIYSQSGAGLSFDLGQIVQCFLVQIVFMTAFILLAILVRKTRANMEK